jgi:hypothetical protein
MGDQNVINIFSLITGAIGTLSGVCALIITSIQFYLEIPRIKLGISEMKTMNHPEYRDGTNICLITITNVGRRPIVVDKVYVKKVAHPGKSFLFSDTFFQGQHSRTLDERNPTTQVLSKITRDEKLSDIIFLGMYDATGKHYYRYLKPVFSFSRIVFEVKDFYHNLLKKTPQT